jgi:hypothetical protein
MQNDDSQNSQQTEPEAARYSRSTIGFPYTPLKDAELIAKQLHDEYGGKATPEQLAASLGASAKSGAFRIKVATARTFGVISVARESLNLTSLGRRLIDPQMADAARVEAFMAVPLFAALAEEYKGVMLPPDSGLEQKIHDLGVSPKQTAKARQAFQRSAELAGFFKHGKQRLVPPANLGSAERREKRPDADRTPQDVPRTTGLPTALVDLWITLLEEGDSWSPDKIQEFLETARKLRTLLSVDG